MSRTLNAITLNAPAAAVTGEVGNTFTFSGTPGFSGTSTVNSYDFKWEVDPGSGYVTINNTTTGLRTAATNPVTNTKQTTIFSATITCSVAGTYTIRMSGAPTTGGSYTVTSATQSITVRTAPQPSALSLALSGATPAVATTANVTVSPTTLAMTLSGATPAVATPVSVSPDALALALAGATPAVATPVAVSPAGLDMALAGATPTVTVSGGADVVVSPGPLALSLSGATPTVAVTANVLVQPAALALALAYGTPTVATTANLVVLPGPLALAFEGYAPHVGKGGGYGGAKRPAVQIQPEPPDESEDELLASLL